MAAIATEKQYLANAIRWETEQDFCRDEVVLATGSNELSVATLLGKKTADGKYAPHNPAATDGTENVAGILCSYDVDATASDIKIIALVRGPAIVKFDQCVQVNALNANQETAAKANLTALSMKVV